MNVHMYFHFLSPLPPPSCLARATPTGIPFRDPLNQLLLKVGDRDSLPAPSVLALVMARVHQVDVALPVSTRLFNK
jgi:hypothetical protein